MKILWVCNLILPEMAEAMGMSSIPKEGWVAGLYYALMGGPKRAYVSAGQTAESGAADMAAGFTEKSANDSASIAVGAAAEKATAEIITSADAFSKPGALASRKPEIVLAFPVPKDKDGITGKVELKSIPGVTAEYYGFYEDTAHPEHYDAELEPRFRRILESAKPDIVHCFGTEFPHTLAVARVWNRPERLFIGIQGPCSVYAEYYMANLPQEVCESKTLRDNLKKDTLVNQQEKFYARARHEQEACALAGHIGGRTAYDRYHAKQWSPKAKYHHAGETLRSVFYEGKWDETIAEPHRIFVSQADYPLKGFHYLLQAAGKLLPDYPDMEIYVAGQSLVRKDLKGKILISAYGKYLKRLLRENGLESKVHFLGRLSAEEMKNQYLLCDTYVCCSANENSPNSMGEAMMLGVPCVISAVGGIPSLFVGAVDGILYPVDKFTPEAKLREIVIPIEPEEVTSLEEKKDREVNPASKKELPDYEKLAKEQVDSEHIDSAFAPGEPEEVPVKELVKALRLRWEQLNLFTVFCENARNHARINHDPDRNVGEMLAIYREMMEE